MPNEEMFGWTEFGLIQDQSDFLQNQRKSCESVFNPAIGAYLTGKIDVLSSSCSVGSFASNTHPLS